MLRTDGSLVMYRVLIMHSEPRLKSLPKSGDVQGLIMHSEPRVEG